MLVNQRHNIYIVDKWIYMSNDSVILQMHAVNIGFISYL